MNFQKSSCGGVAVAEHVMNCCVNMLNCKPMNLPFVYLGIPVGANPHRLVMWRPIIEKVKKKLADWRRRSLSFGGRICLVKSVLSALPLFYFLFLKHRKVLLKYLQGA